ncbi:hypothetical protein [Streptomyces sulphureus]|uniref:hypothetical protein n=1 Tax=Streptomyces sulphureus TaxID=47758 RepID=UPI0003698CAC|nr:hypothetical protein [Streptomyces sulphureus]
MACSCQGKRQQFEVVRAGKVLFTSASEATAKAVSGRYTGSTVRRSPKPGDNSGKNNSVSAKTIDRA